jgi:hypothetical protein
MSNVEKQQAATLFRKWRVLLCGLLQEQGKLLMRDMLSVLGLGAAPICLGFKDPICDFAGGTHVFQR